MNASDYVHEWTDAQGRVWYVVAEYREGRYYARQRPDVRKVTGCHTTFGPLDYVVGDAYSYKNRRDALRRARLLYGEVAP